ncbi:MAG TPA: MBL fold metallo-hydrolase [Gemmatimonadaceae bacterium]|nr:MBL fold metallo-hydrolase [Gemmatimonadaceae bacterium]
MSATGAIPLRVTYIGHATLLLEIGGVRVLTDPNFEPRLGGILPRVSAPGIALSELPALDAVLLTHGHADHLSFATLDALPRAVPIHAPPSIARWLGRRQKRDVRGMVPGDCVMIGSVELRVAAARHAGARYVVDWWRGAANMYLLDSGEHSCFFAGDTALTPYTHTLVEERLRSRGRRLDVALLPIGHAPWWKPGFRRNHLTPEDALALFERLDARVLVPYHWGTFRHLTAGPFDAIDRLRARLDGYDRRADVRILAPGEAFEQPAGARAMV